MSRRAEPVVRARLGRDGKKLRRELQVRVPDHLRERMAGDGDLWSVSAPLGRASGEDHPSQASLKMFACLGVLIFAGIACLWIFVKIVIAMIWAVIILAVAGVLLRFLLD